MPGIARALCATCDSPKRRNYDGETTYCPHCDRGCATCTVDPLEGTGRRCPKGERGRYFDGIGPNSIRPK